MPTATTSATERTAAGRSPVETFRHFAISASVFQNDGDKGPWYSVSLQRAYKQGDEFKHSSSFTRAEVPVVDYLLKKAYAYILKREQEDREADLF